MMLSHRDTPDVVVIGAGAAGLSAASALIEAGFETLVLEADAHVGGRCITDTTTFSSAFDRGGSWLHSAEINPLATLAQQHGFPLHKKPWKWEKVLINHTPLSEQEVAEYRDYMDQMWKHILAVGKQGTSSVVDEILPASRWKDTAKLFIAQMLGGDYDVTSPEDIANYEETEGNWLVGGGLGNFIHHLHQHVPVELNCPVSKIDYSGPKIKITTPRGTVETDQIVSTVSVGVLAAEKIEFIPPLPNHKLQAISDLPNGLLNKVGIEFDPKWCEAHEGLMVDYHIEGEQYCCLLFRFFDSDLATGFTAGRFASLLEREGNGAATEFCLQAIRETFGQDALKYIKQTSETAWDTNPNTYGSYSYALPGCVDARQTLSEPIHEKLYFAGEATMKSEFATVHGAYLSGKRVAKEIAMAKSKATANEPFIPEEETCQI